MRNTRYLLLLITIASVITLDYVNVLQEQGTNYNTVSLITNQKTLTTLDNCNINDKTNTLTNADFLVESSSIASEKNTLLVIVVLVAASLALAIVIRKTNWRRLC
jgi:hypothetical protein